MMLSVILLFMLMMLLCTSSVIKYLICSNNQRWLLNLNLIYDAMLTGAGRGDFNGGETQLFSFDRSYNIGAIDVKTDGFVLEEKSSFKMLGLSFSFKLNWGSYISNGD